MCDHCKSGTDLVKVKEGSFFVCAVCGIYHDRTKQILGWPIQIKGVFGGIIPLEDFVGVSIVDLTKPAHIAQIVCIAAKIGLQKPDLLASVFKKNTIKG